MAFSLCNDQEVLAGFAVLGGAALSLLEHLQERTAAHLSPGGGLCPGLAGPPPTGRRRRRRGEAGAPSETPRGSLAEGKVNPTTLDSTSSAGTRRGPGVPAGRPRSGRRKIGHPPSRNFLSGGYLPALHFSKVPH